MAASIQVTYEGTVYEIFPSEQVPIRLNLSNVENTQIGDFHGSLSQSFRIPGSAVNNRFFNFLFSTVTGTGPGFNTAIPCVVKNEGQILFSGDLSVDEIVDNGGDVEYVVSIEDRTLSINDLLSGHRVIDLDSSGLLHEYSPESIVGSWTVDPSLTVETTSSNPMCGTWLLPANDEETSWRYLDCSGDLQRIVVNANESLQLTNSLNIFEPQPYISEGFTVSPVIGLTPTFMSGVEVTTPTASDGLAPVLSGNVFYPLIDQGSDGVIDDEDFGYISTDASTITSESATAGSWNSGATSLANLDSYLRTQQLTPAISVPLLINKILQQADPNITWESEFIDRFLDRAYILPKAYDGLGIVTDSNIAVNGFRSGVDSSLRTFEYDGTAATNNEIRNRTRITNIPTGTAGAAFDGSRFTFPVRGTYELVFGMEVASFDRSGLSGGAAGQFHDVRFNIEIYDGAGNRQDPGVDLEQNPIEFRLADSGSTTSIELGNYQATTRANVNAGWYAEVYTEGYRNKGNRDVFVTITNVSFGTEQEPLVWDGVTCNPLHQFDNDLLSIDLMTAILRQFNLVLVPVEEREKHYEIIQYNDWIRTGTTRDWSYKLDRSQGISIVPLISEQSKTITFVGSEEDDPFSVESRIQSPRRELGSRIYPNVELDGEINTSKAEGDETIGEFFSPIAIGSISSVDQTATPRSNSGEIVHTYNHNNGAKETVVFAPKIGFRSQFISSRAIIGASESEGRISPRGGRIQARYIRTSGHRTLTPYNTLPGFSGDVLFSTNWSTRSDYPGYNPGTHQGCYDAFWKNYIDNLYREDNIKFTGSFYFAPHELATLRLNDPIYLDGQAYLINRINGFNLTEPDTVEVELIRYYGDLPTFAEENPDIPANTISIVSDVGGSDEFIRIDVGDDVVFTATTLPSSLDNIWCRQGLRLNTTRSDLANAETIVAQGKSLLLTNAQVSSTGVYSAKLLDGTESNTITVVVGDEGVSFPDEWIFAPSLDDEITMVGRTINGIGSVSSITGLPAWLENDSIGTPVADGLFSDQDITKSTIQVYCPGYEGAPTNGQVVTMDRATIVTYVTGSINTPITVTQRPAPHVYAINNAGTRMIAGTTFQNYQVAHLGGWIRNASGSLVSDALNYSANLTDTAGVLSPLDLVYFPGGRGTNYDNSVIEASGIQSWDVPLTPVASFDVTYTFTITNNQYPLNLISTTGTIPAGEARLEIDPDRSTVGRPAGTVDVSVDAFSVGRWTFSEDTDWFSAERIDDTTLRVTFTENFGATSRSGTITFTHVDNPTLTRVFTLTQSTTVNLSISPTALSVSNTAGTTSNFTVAVEGETEQWRFFSIDPLLSVSISESAFHPDGQMFTATYPANTGPEREFTIIAQHRDSLELRATAVITQAAADPSIAWDVDTRIVDHTSSTYTNEVTTGPNANTYSTSVTEGSLRNISASGSTVTWRPEENRTLSDRTITIRATHSSDSAVFDDLVITQLANPNGILTDQDNYNVDSLRYDLTADPTECFDVVVTFPTDSTGYTAVIDCSWLTGPTALGGTRGTRTYRYCATQNNSDDSRTCTITFVHPDDSDRNKSVTVTQSGDTLTTPTVDGLITAEVNCNGVFTARVTGFTTSLTTSVEFQYGQGDYSNSVNARTTDIGNVRTFTATTPNRLTIGTWQIRVCVNTEQGVFYTNMTDIVIPDLEIVRYLAGHVEGTLDQLLFEIELDNTACAQITDVEFQYGIGNYNSTIGGIQRGNEYTASTGVLPHGVYQTRCVITYDGGRTLISQRIDVTLE